MDASSINQAYINLIKKHDFTDDYQMTIEKVKHSNAIYKGKPIPFLYHPMFFTKKDIKTFEYITKMLMSIGNKVVDEYVNSVTYRKKFNFSNLLEKLILHNQGYDVPTPIGRFDLFYNGKDYMFCEFNTDGSSAMNEDNTLAKILLETEAIKAFKETYQINYYDSINTWVNESLHIYDTFIHKKEDPTIAIVDFIESATIAEFEEFKKAYENQGYKTYICDIRDLVYQNKQLTYKGNPIDLVYRRVVTKELIERNNEVEDFIQAYLDNAVCVIGPFKSQILHHKIIFKILHDEETLNLLSEEEKDFVKKHIPITKPFTGDASVFNEVLKHKDKYIIKPFDLYGSRGVYVGLDYTVDEWKEIINEAFNQDYLYQEYFHPFERDFIQFTDKRIEISSFKSITGLFIYNEKFKGLYTRIGKNRIISGLHGYYTVPNLLVESRE